MEKVIKPGESHKYINWGYMFYSSMLNREGSHGAAINVMEKITENYVSSLNNDKLHPHLERFWSILANSYAGMKEYGKAIDIYYNNYIRLLERLHGDSSIQIMKPANTA